MEGMNMTHRTLLLLLCFGSVCFLSNIRGVPVGHDTGPVAVDNECSSRDTLRQTVERFSGPLAEHEFAELKQLLVSNSKKSTECRQRVVSLLIESMKTHDLSVAADEANADTWIYGSELLAEL